MGKSALYILLFAITALMLINPALSIKSYSQDSGVCDEIVGPPKGLCYVYCEIMECDSDSISVGAEYCGRVYDKYVEYTGDLPPCEAESCGPGIEACEG